MADTCETLPAIVFPLDKPPLRPFFDKGHNLVTAFGHNRDGGRRTHAAVDLYAPAGSLVYAIADGKILRFSEAFTAENRLHNPLIPATGAIEVQHPGLGIFRYGEVDPDRRPLFIWQNAQVKKGQLIGFVGSQGGDYRQ